VTISKINTATAKKKKWDFQKKQKYFVCWIFYFFTCQRNNGTSILYAAPVCFISLIPPMAYLLYKKNTKEILSLPPAEKWWDFFLYPFVLYGDMPQLDEKERTTTTTRKILDPFFMTYYILLPSGISIVKDSNFL
jgi:hypothetical protein